MHLQFATADSREEEVVAPKYNFEELIEKALQE
jgi:hypothetical protein